ncbi:MAG: alpha-L-fucosidase [Christensenellales bacterium]|jgi:alpha-L-fucosidase
MAVKKLSKEMTGAELQSMLKSSINFKSLGGVRCDELRLSKEDMQWWKDAKVGMFIHWGLYSILGRGEWVRHNEQIPYEEYSKLADEFNPENFSPSEWVDLAKDMGAKYMVMVSRHHDGFSLWNSPGSYESFTSWDSASRRDFVGEYVKAAREEGMKVGIYYSPMDWRFPGYFDPEGLPENAALMKKQCYDQVGELTTNYGPIDILWYDGGWLAHKGSDASSAWFWEPEKLNRMARENSPKAVINPRSGWQGDFYCDEGSHEMKGDIVPVPWEKCICICSGVSWGWMPDDPVSDLGFLIKMLSDIICRGGNLLLNIGPDKNGKLSDEVRGRLKELGDWIRENAEAVYGTFAGPFQPEDDVFGSVYKEDNIYLHVQDVKTFGALKLPAIEAKILSAQILGGKSCEFTQDESGIGIRLPEDISEKTVTVVKLALDRAIPKPEDADIYFTGKE